MITATAEGVAGCVPEQVRGEAMGWHGSALTIGSAIGAPLAGAAIDAIAPWAGFAVVGATGSRWPGSASARCASSGDVPRSSPCARRSLRLRAPCSDGVVPWAVSRQVAAGGSDSSVRAISGW